MKTKNHHRCNRARKGKQCQRPAGHRGLCMINDSSKRLVYWEAK